MAEIAIIGLGSWGLCALERIVDHARREPMAEVTVHVIEPAHPGGGLYSVSCPDYLILNTPCSQHAMHPDPDHQGEGRISTFYEWVGERGYRWNGHECRTSGPGTPVAPQDFLPRRVMGEYLDWVYERLVAEAPQNVEVVHHATNACDMVATDDERERICLDDEISIVVDHVILTTGHTKNVPSDRALDSLEDRPYPVEPYLGATGPHEKVAIEGMGLVAVDVVTALTVGLGGTYTTDDRGKLRYHKSGREPSIYLYSRSGFPYYAKSLVPFEAAYTPAICTLDAVADLQRAGAMSDKRGLDARKDLLPLVFAEMELCYYTRACLMSDGAPAAAQIRADLVEAWAAGTFAEARSTLAVRYGAFDASHHFFIGEHSTFLDGKEYQAEVWATVEDDLGQALLGGNASPVKAAFDMLRGLRAVLRVAIEFKGLTASSYLDFQSNLWGRFARLMAGPPVLRSRQLLALMEADILKIPFGPSPELVPGPAGVTIRSTRLDRPVEVVVDRVIRAHLDMPSVTRSASPLLNNLVTSGRIKPLEIDGTPVGSIDLTEEFHPIGAGGSVEPRLWVLGVLTEGVRYFTMYIPSPKTRGAFVDAQACVDRMITSTP